MGDAKSTAISWKDIGIVTGIHSAIAVVCFVIFSILRSRHYTRKYYAPKLYDKNLKYKPTRLLPSLLGWIGPVLSYREDDVILISGLDLAVYLRILKLGINLSLSLAFICLPILVPIHLTSDGLASANADIRQWNKYVLGFERAKNSSAGLVKAADCKWETRTSMKLMTLSDIDKTYMTNLIKSTEEHPNHRLWAHMLLSYVVIFIIIYWLNKFNQDITKLRVKFLATLPRGGPSHTALITDIPGVKAGTVIHTLNKTMNKTVLRVAPNSLKSRVNSLLEDTADLAVKGLSTVGKARALLDQDYDIEMDDSKLSEGQKALRLALADPWISASEYLEQGGDFRGLVTQEMGIIFGRDKVVAINPVYNQETLQPIHAKYESVKSQLEDIVDDYLGKIKQTRDPAKINLRETAVLGPMYGAWGMERYGKTKRVKVDTLEFLCDYFDEVKRQVREAEEPAYDDPTCSAFVTFRDRVSQTAASTSLICQSEMVWRGQAAPGPEEVVWDNLSMRFWERNLRNMAMWALFITIVLTFTIVCAFLQSVVVDGPITQKMGVVLELPVVGAIIQGVLPTIVILIFLAILPMILARMQRFAGAVSTSEIDFGVVSKFYWFQFFTVFIGAVVGGALLTQVNRIIKNPNAISSIIEGVFNSIPGQASFFINYILLKGLAAKSINLLRVVGLVLFFIFSKLAATERAKTRLWANQETSMGTEAASHNIIMLLMITFCVASPVILVFGFLYFLVTSITERYQMIYVYRLPYESGGKMWRIIFGQVMVAAYTFLITMAFLIGAKNFAYTPLIIPAFAFLLLFHSQTVKMSTRPWVIMSLRSAALLDNVEHQAGYDDISSEEVETIKQTYLSPVFKVSDAEHEALKNEAKRVQQYFAGELQYQDMMLDDDDVPES